MKIQLHKFVCFSINIFSMLSNPSNSDGWVARRGCNSLSYPYSNNNGPKLYAIKKRMMNLRLLILGQNNCQIGRILFRILVTYPLSVSSDMTSYI